MASTHRDEISRLELLYAAHPDGLVFPHLADAYRRAGRFAQAESILDAGLRKHSDYSSAHVVLGRLRLDQGKENEAHTAFLRVLQLDPQNQVALEYLGEMAAREDRIEEALGYLRRLARLKNDEGLAARVQDLQDRLAGRQGSSERPEPVEFRNGRNGVPSPDMAPPASPPTPGASARAPEPGEVVTETMAELYARQGLYERAAGVYRQLLSGQPHDTRLRSKLDQVRRQLERSGQRAPGIARSSAGRGPGDSPTASVDGPASPPPAPATRESAPAAIMDPARALGPGAPEPFAAVGDRRGALRSLATAPEERAAPPIGEATASPSIRSQLRGVLTWAPTGANGAAPAAAAVAEPDRAVRPASAPSSVESGFPGAGPRPRGATGGHSLGPGDWPEERSPFRAGSGEGNTPRSTSAVAGFRSGARVSSAGAPPSASRTGRTARRAGGFALPGSEPEAAEPDSSAWHVPSAAVVGAEDHHDAFEDASSQTRALIALTDLLVGLLEYRDPFFRGSSSLTRLLATNVAQEMGLSRDRQVDLALAAILRDLGRLALGGRLVAGVRPTPTPEGRRKIERHVDLAIQLLEGIDLPPEVRVAVRHHHERWDGAGYPDGLAGDEIPLLARILAVVDSFAAMVSPRPYRLPRKVPEAAEELRAESGTQYDPVVVDALLRILARREQPHLGLVQRHHVLIVSPDQPGALVMATKLSSAGYLPETAADIRTARERLRRVPVAALVVSAESGPESTTAFVRDLRLDPLFTALPIVVMDAANVNTRVKLLENGADVCFPPGLTYGELLGTLGALVRRTLRSRARQGPPATSDEESPWLALQGDIQDFPLTWLLQVMKYDSRTAAIGIRTSEEEGAIYLRNGDAVHAQIRHGARGESALRRMLQWRRGRFTVQPDARPEQQTITTSIMHLLLTQAVAEDHAAAGVFGAVSAEN